MKKELSNWFHSNGKKENKIPKQFNSKQFNRNVAKNEKNVEIPEIMRKISHFP